TGFLSGHLTVSDADIQAVIGAHGLGGRIDFSTAVSASGKSVGGLVAGLSGSGTAALKSLTVDGINPDALASFVVWADAIGKDIDVVATETFTPAIAAAGSFAARPVETAFTVAGGVLRAPPLRLASDAVTVEADLLVDLNDGRVAASGEIAWSPGQEALVGSEPILRFAMDGTLNEAERKIDSQPLARFLVQRALEIEQARVEAMQAGLLERQRLRRESRYFAELQAEHERTVLEARRQEAE